jgi:phosphoglycerate dehydrogenase-like enzyme
MRGSGRRRSAFGLEGKVLGVVGLGKLGRRVAAVGRAFGMEVVAWSQNLSEATRRPAGRAGGEGRSCSRQPTW